MAQLLAIKKWVGTVEGMEDDGEGWGGLPNVCVCVCVCAHVCGQVCLPLHVTCMKNCTKPKGRN